LIVASRDRWPFLGLKNKISQAAEKPFRAIEKGDVAAIRFVYALWTVSNDHNEQNRPRGSRRPRLGRREPQNLKYARSSVKRPHMGFVPQHIVRGRFRKRDFALRAFIVATVEGAASRASTNTPIRLKPRLFAAKRAFVAHRTTAPGRQAVHGEGDRNGMRKRLATTTPFTGSKKQPPAVVKSSGLRLVLRRSCHLGKPAVEETSLGIVGDQ
jgi:hypothetical protein